MLILNRPKCVKCEEPAITIINRHWLCGKCFMKFQEKKQKMEDKLILEE
jgi:hypothetical protein